MEQPEQKEKTLATKVRGVNNGFSIKKNGIVEIKIQCDGSQIVNVLGILQLAGQSIKAVAKIGDEKVKIGIFSFYGLHIDRDGDAKLVLQSDSENVNMVAVEALYQEQEVVKFIFASAEKVQ